MQLYFEEFGSGPPLIVLHGLFGSSDNWQTLSRRLAAKFHVFAVDQRNHGRSPHAADMNYPLMAADLQQFLRDRALPAAALLGHSMGGKTAMQFASRHPAQTECLVVADIAPRQYEPSHLPILDALLSLDPDRFHSRQEMEKALAPSIPDLAVRRFLLKNLGRDSQGKFYWKPNLQNIRRNYEALTAPVDFSRPAPAPALFIRGGRSGYIRDEDAVQIRRLFPKAEIETLPEAGHWLHAEATESFLALTENFLLKHVRA